ncbi:MAG: hypothetical protein AB7V62_10445 [Thermoleophilia bacterium]
MRDQAPEGFVVCMSADEEILLFDIEWGDVEVLCSDLTAITLIAHYEDFIAESIRDGFVFV